jgi:transcriptional regulator with GAF, ATPase, and Fis domain
MNRGVELTERGQGKSKAECAMNPGNDVYEPRSALARAACPHFRGEQCVTRRVTPVSLLMTLRLACAPLTSGAIVVRSCDGSFRPTTLRSQRAAAERDMIQRALAENDGVVARAARSLGISRQSFYKAMQRSGV